MAETPHVPNRGPNNDGVWLIRQAETLANIEERLCRIEEFLTKPTFDEALRKSRYSVTEIAALSEWHGVKCYAPYTVRKACAEGRIPEAQKLDDGKTWYVPRDAVLRILEEGFPPERRNGNGD